MPQRLTYRRRLCYNTKSNKTKHPSYGHHCIITVTYFAGIENTRWTFSFLYRKKKGSVARCGDTGVKLKGVKPARPRQLRKMTKRLKTVTRAYGGCLSAAAVRERIIRAFLIEEQKIVARVLKAKIKAEKK
ncbi:50S ribosomal protein L34e [Wuchereria bancrofti]|uniref:Large ribosomal subunit protein eL34 n=1 Tax=Wuchereria bancrofti TaxID=6293 RepID=J9AQI9_WUCBA|nr:50S ribosomal protein L34e [Wuchereria bancrofti]